MAKRVVGREAVVEQLLVALLARGHVLLEGVPGLAKTVLVRSLAEAVGLSFRRIPLTRDLTPSDVTGTEVIREDLETGRRAYQFLPGPIFANVILADEISHAPPKTQAAVFEAMQERQISCGGKAHPLPEPLVVVATQSPLEQEEGCPLAAAQLDRFLVHVRVDYPSGAEEWEVARRATAGPPPRVAPVLTGPEVLEIQRLVARLPVSDQVLRYAWTLVRATRPGTPEALDFIDRWVAWGAGPRGLLARLTCAKARAVLHGRDQATAADVQATIHPALRHRIAPNQVAQANNLTSDALVDMLLEAITDGF